MASLLAAIIRLTMAVQITNNVMKKQHQGVPVWFHIHPCPSFQVLRTPTNTYDGLFEDGKRAAAKINKSLTSNAIKRINCTNLILLLSFSSLYQNGDIEVFMKKMINDTNDFTETHTQNIIEPLLCYSASVRVLSWGHITLVKNSVLLVQESLSHLPPHNFCILSNSIKWIVISIDIARIFPLDKNVRGLTWEEFNKISSLYWNGDIETINDTIDFTEPLVQQIF